LAGCGGISNAWLTPAANIKDLEIVGLVDLKKANTTRVQEKYGLDDAVTGTDLAKVIKETKPDAVFDCTIPEAHVDVVTTAFKHGCHVLGEKPLADSMANARKMVKAGQKAGKIYSVIQNRRYQPAARRVHNLLHSGKLGEMHTVDCDFYLGPHFGGFRDVMQHVLLLDMAIHTFDMARFLTEADPVKVYCKEFNPKGSWYKHGASAVAVFEMSGGMVYTYRGSWCAQGCGTTWECDWRFGCTKGSARWDGAESIQAQALAPTKKEPYRMKEIAAPKSAPKDKQGGHDGLLREFVRCVQTGRQPETRGDDNIKSLAMVFGAIESAKVGKEIKVKI
ncbi:MAG: Gfo/Idh/MocA family protein, partial [Planctomycetota bacterium]